LSDEVQELKRQFLEDDVLLLTLQGALATRNQSSPVYGLGVSDREKELLKTSIREKLWQIGRRYIAVVSESDHIHNIERLASDLTDAFGDILDAGKFRIGIAQKLLNLYLKYCWALGWIPEPPHCPFDARIVRKLELTRRLSWAEIDTIEEYGILVSAAKDRAREVGLSIAHWELKKWPE